MGECMAVTVAIDESGVEHQALLKDPETSAQRFATKPARAGHNIQRRAVATKYVWKDKVGGCLFFFFFIPHSKSTLRVSFLSLSFFFSLFFPPFTSSSFQILVFFLLSLSQKKHGHIYFYSIFRYIELAVVLDQLAVGIFGGNAQTYVLTIVNQIAALYSVSFSLFFFLFKNLLLKMVKLNGEERNWFDYMKAKSNFYLF